MSNRARRVGQTARIQARRRRARWIAAATVAGLVLAGLLGWGVYQSQRATGDKVPAHATAAGTGLVDGGGPVTVEVWLDLHCPHCRTFEQQAGETLDQLVADGTITRVYHPVAFLDRFSTTAYSSRAAAAIGCAADQDAHVRYLAALLQAQQCGSTAPRWSPPSRASPPRSKPLLGRATDPVGAGHHNPREPAAPLRRLSI